MKQDFVSRWFRGETRWNAPVCLAVAILCAGTALLVASVTHAPEIVYFNVVCAALNLACYFMFRARYRDWLAQQGLSAKKPR